MKRPTPPLDLRQLRALAAVIDHGGHTRAAKHLGLSQSTISEALASLERTIGEPLLRREGRRVVPTETGQLVLATARTMLEAEAQLETQLAGRATAGSVIRLGAHESVSSYLLPAALARAAEAWPRHEWTVTLGNCAALREKLQHDEIDAALVIEPRNAHASRDARADALREIELAFFAAASHPLARRRNIALGDVPRIVLTDAAGTYERVLHAHFEENGFPPPRITRMGSVEAVKHWVRENANDAGVLPRFALGNEKDRIAILRVTPTLPLLELRLIAPREVKAPIDDVRRALTNDAARA